MKTISEIECRIERLKLNPVRNARLIKKWERILRNAKDNKD